MVDWPAHLQQTVAEVLFDAEQIRSRVRQLADQISTDYQRADLDALVVVGILRGSVPFLSDLIRQIQLPVVIDFMAMSSYAHGVKTSGSVHILKDISEPITDKDVLIVEDIVDTGLTLSVLLEMLQARRPKSLKVCTLLSKPARREVEVPVDYCGFTVPDKFVVGYGLDYNGHYRHLPYVGVLHPEAYA